MTEELVEEATAELQVFENDKYKIRSFIDDNGDYHFVAQDVCQYLMLTDTSKTLERLDDDEKGTNSVRTPGGNQDMLTVTEAGLYRLIGTSKKAEAKEFQRWVYHEVLPSIRKTGSYFVRPISTVEMFSLQAKINEEHEQRILANEKKIQDLTARLEFLVENSSNYTNEMVDALEENMILQFRKIRELRNADVTAINSNTAKVDNVTKDLGNRVGSLEVRVNELSIGSPRELIRTTINYVVQVLKDKGYQGRRPVDWGHYYSMYYQSLSEASGVNLRSRLTRQKNRALANGASVTVANAINILDVIEGDKSLWPVAREIAGNFRRWADDLEYA